MKVVDTRDLYRSSVDKIIVLKNFENSRENKVVDIQACNFTKKSLQHRYFYVSFAKFLRTFFYETSQGECFFLCSLVISKRNVYMMSIKTLSGKRYTEAFLKILSVFTCSMKNFKFKTFQLMNLSKKCNFSQGKCFLVYTTSVQVSKKLLIVAFEIEYRSTI